MVLTLGNCCYRCEALQLQSQLADAQDEAQLLRRLLTLCNQALSDPGREGQSRLANIQEEQRSQDSSQQELLWQGATHQVCLAHPCQLLKCFNTAVCLFYACFLAKQILLNKI